MKVLIYGSRGWIGGMMAETLRSMGHKVISGAARLNNFKKLDEEIGYIRPDRIFSSTGRTHGTANGTVYGTIDYLELPGKLQENIRDNLTGPLNLAMICKNRGIHLAYIGTGCIFQYDEEHPLPHSESAADGIVGGMFAEESDPNFFGSGYSTVKGQTDLLMRNMFDDTVLNCRIRMPITGNDNPRNFITKITHYEKICSIPNSMTVLPHILPIIVHMMETGAVGTFNLTNPGYITHNRILDMYKEIVDPEFRYQNFSLEEQARILLSGRSNNTLSTEKLRSYCEKHQLLLDPIETAVRKALISYKAQAQPAEPSVCGE